MKTKSETQIMTITKIITPARARRILRDRGYSYRTAAEVLGCAETTISWHVHEARKRLKVLLRDAAA